MAILLKPDFLLYLSFVLFLLAYALSLKQTICHASQRRRLMGMPMGCAGAAAAFVGGGGLVPAVYARGS